jgi:transducin beta-like protein 2
LQREIKVWDGKTGKLLGAVETNQLKNNMATISSNGRFLVVAAFTTDMKVCYPLFHTPNE